MDVTQHSLSNINCKSNKLGINDNVDNLRVDNSGKNPYETDNITVLNSCTRDPRTIASTNKKTNFDKPSNEVLWWDVRRKLDLKVDCDIELNVNISRQQTFTHSSQAVDFKCNKSYVDGTLDIENQDSYSSTRENELSSSINEKVPIEVSENEIRTDNLVSTSSGFNDSEIPTPNLCRICLQSDLDESNKCISPCFCRGSISKVHKTCLEKWLLQASSTVCEICTYVYKTRRVTKYSLLGSIKAWFFSSESIEEIKELFYDGCVLVITLPFISLFSYVGFSITEHIFNTDVQIKYDMVYRVVSFSACWAILCADFFFCFWTSCRIQHHVLNWYNFYKNNQSIILESELPEDSM
ncbi:uncharacterized protein LOC113560138 [Rhopalosiphum maidis]|uniref:uncharacterized protein LOC113560138 n=1 Tax=Rhopalosiphum maidis TaxID=43146 RepID=UPI00101BB47F|nr:uncharacterized protein LOC113560138 [Rhopalosiphum maidis]